MNNISANILPRLDNCDQETIKQYFINSWQLEETLLKTINKEEIYYQQSDKLRNPLIFYLGHSAIFYINKLLLVGLLQERINPHYEKLFAIGVDPDTPDELHTVIKDLEWPKLKDVWQYRDQVYETILKVINRVELNLPITPDNPLWALMMGIDHSRVHFETSSVLWRQLPTTALKSPENWQYAPSSGEILDNPMIEIAGGSVEFGKAQDFPAFGWDIEYGDRTVEVKPFLASKYLITNGEFLKFVEAGGYENKELWSDEAWRMWKQEYNITQPKFWIATAEGYKYRAMFDEIDLPLDYPVEVNHYEAMAYCAWKGKEYRLMSEGEWNLALKPEIEGILNYKDDITNLENYNLNLQWGSPTPVNFFENKQNGTKLCDLRGNLWQWLEDDFNPLDGFKPHFLYKDYASIYFDSDHKMMLGGSWASNGSMSSKYYRNWFRPQFYQHAGFRIAKDFN